MVVLKGCTNCGGDLYMRQEVDGSYVSCLQCSRIMADLDPEIRVTSIEQALSMTVELRRSA